jgi:ribonuclease HI
VAGAGGIIVDPKGNEENFFLWGLGRATNNQAKSLSLFEGSRVVNDIQHMRLIVTGDSKLVIKSMRKNDD